MTKREAILQGVVEMFFGHHYLPSAQLDEPEPTAWHPLEHYTGVEHFASVMDGATPDQLAFVRGNADQGDELELEIGIGYAVQVKPEPGRSVAVARELRRRLRDEAVEFIACMIRGNPTLYVDQETWAEVTAVTRDDDVPIVNAVPAATAIITVRVLYTGADPAA